MLLVVVATVVVASGVPDVVVAVALAAIVVANNIEVVVATMRLSLPMLQMSMNTWQSRWEW